MLGTTLLILYVKIQEIELTDSQVTCATDTAITEVEALADLQLPEAEQSSKMYCYCTSVFRRNIAEQKNPYDDLRYVFDDGVMHCWDWFYDYSLSKGLLYSVPLAIVMVNFIVKTFLRVITKMNGYQSKPEEVAAASVNMAIMTFINSAIVIQLVYFDWAPPDFEIPLILAEYDSFSQAWYQEIGTTIVITLLLMVITPHASNVGFACLGSCTRCMDRGCSSDTRKTKALVQEDYEEKNIGAEFQFEFRYANLLVVLAIAFLYSGGMPVLYPAAAMSCFFQYWFDKCLLLRCYRKPIKYDNHLARHTLGYFKWILVLHMGGFLLMYGLTPILQEDIFEHFIPKEVGLVDQEELRLFPYYFWLIAGLLASYLVYTFFL